MLLTSGQVSVAISSIVVFMFTSALFLSGYVLQQQTVRDLRAAIQPKPTPEAARLYLPTQFAVQPTPSPKAHINENLEGPGAGIDLTEDRERVAEVKGSIDQLSADASPEEYTVEGGRTQKVRKPSQHDLVSTDTVDGQKPMAVAENQPLSQIDLSEEVLISKANSQPKEKQMSKAERRKKIKEEIMAAGDGEGFKGYKRRQW